MKSIIVTLPAMGKTTLVKHYRDENWRDSLGVDFDLKGMNSYTDRVRAANTAYISTVLSDDRHTFVTTFNGQVNVHDLIAQGINVYFVVPVSRQAKSAALLRSYFRKDSRAFTQLYQSNIDIWVNDIIDAYNREALTSTRPGYGKCYLIQDKHGKVLTQLFACDPDTGELRCKLALDNANTYCYNEAQPLDRDFMDDLYGYFSGTCPHDLDDRVRFMFDKYFTSIYPENLYYSIHPEEGVRYVTLVHFAKEFNLEYEYRGWFEDPDITIHQASIDMIDHDVARARLNCSYWSDKEQRVITVNEFHYVIGGKN